MLCSKRECHWDLELGKWGDFGLVCNMGWKSWCHCWECFLEETPVGRRKRWGWILIRLLNALCPRFAVFWWKWLQNDKSMIFWRFQPYGIRAYADLWYRLPKPSSSRGLKCILSKMHSGCSHWENDLKLQTNIFKLILRSQWNTMLFEVLSHWWSDRLYDHGFRSFPGCQT